MQLCWFKRPFGKSIWIGVLGFSVLLWAAVGVCQEFTDWSAPQNLGPTVNSLATDGCPAISRDGLSLYFASARSGGQGGLDIYVSQRASLDDPWGPPVNLGPTINSAGNDFCPGLSRDSHLLFFASNGRGGCGGSDLFVSRRQDARDDFGWQTPENLGCTVNSDHDDFGPNYYESEDGTVTLYFNSNRAGGSGGQDIYATSHGPGEEFGLPLPVVELNSSANDQQPAIRRDGLEILFASSRPGGQGGLDLWMATRESTSDLWSQPVNLSSLNSAGDEARPALSWDATELYFGSTRERAGGFTDSDLYVSRRSKVTGKP